jgi:hypothetical protein
LEKGRKKKNKNSFLINLLKRNFFLVLQRSCKGFLGILVAKIWKKKESL